VNRYVGHGGAGLAGELDRVYRDSRLSGFIFLRDWRLPQVLSVGRVLPLVADRRTGGCAGSEARGSTPGVVTGQRVLDGESLGRGDVETEVP